MFEHLDQFSPFADSRDGSFGTQDRMVSDAMTGALRADGRMQHMPPVGNMVNAERLVPFSQRLSAGMTPEETRRVPAAIYNGGIYADMVQMLVPLAAGQEALALPRPKNTRILLVIQNPGVSNLYVAFDQVASNAAMAVPPNGNLFFDAAVPQNDIHILYGAAVDILIPVFYMTADLARNVP